MAGNAQIEEGLTSFHEAIDLIETGALDVGAPLELAPLARRGRPGGDGTRRTSGAR